MTETEILNKLNLGQARDVLNNQPNSPLGKLLLDLTNDVVIMLKSALKKRDINTSSMGLSQSIQPTDVILDGRGVSVGISMEFYWKYVNYGVNGTEVNHGAPSWGPAPVGEKSFSQAIRDWIPQRGVQLPPQFRSYDSFAFAIMTNIRKHGKEARPFFSDVINRNLVDVLKKPIEDLIGRAITVQIVAPWQ